jgi:rubrerythrin
MEFERDTIVFYEMILAFIESGDTKEQLREFIREENRHISLLEEYRKKKFELLKQI